MLLKKVLLGVFLTLILTWWATLPAVNAASKVSVIENTDRCKLDPKLNLDFCYTTYLIKDTISIKPGDISFKFKTDKKDEYVNTLNHLNYDYGYSKIGSDYILNITAYKSPFEDVDNILCLGPDCYYEYIWWNSSYLYRFNVTIQNPNITDILYPNWTINISADTTNVSYGDCRDVAIVFNVTEINGSFVNITECNTSDSQIWFPLQAQVPVLGETMPYEYFLYLGSIGATGIRQQDYYNTFFIPNWYKDRNDIIGFYPMDNRNTSVLTDYSYYKNDFYEVASGSKSISSIKNIFGQYVDFDNPANKEYQIATATAPEFDTGQGNFWVSFWIKPESCQTDSQDMILDWRYGASEYGGIAAITNTCAINFNLNGAGAGTLDCTSTKLLPINGWSHVVLMGNDTGINMFINGYNQYCTDTDPGQGDLFIAGDSIHIGCRYDANDGDLDAGMDDLIWSNGTLTEAEINMMYFYPYNPPTLVYGLAYNGSEGSFIPPPPPNITMNYTMQFCYNDQYLFKISRDVNESGDMIFNNYLEYCTYGCSNFTLWNLGNPGCIESPLIQFSYLLMFFFVLFIILYKVERNI